MINCRTLIAIAATAAAATGAAPALAQGDYPQEPISIIVGFSAGGPSDTYARLLADHLQQSLGQPVVVENRTGANTMLAAGYVAQAEPDGYTLLFNTNSTYTNLFLYDAPYEAQQLQPIGLMFSGAAFVVAPPDSQFNSLPELIVYARENPGELDFSTTGLGGSVHLTGEYFAMVFDAEINPISYGGGSAALQGVMNGEVALSFIGAAAAVPQIQAGTVKALAITEPARIESLPDVPTVDEAAIELGMEDPEWDTGAWYGLFTTAGTPDEIVEILNSELADFVASPAIQERLANEGNVPGGNLSPAAFLSFAEKDTANWGRVIEERNVTVD